MKAAINFYNHGAAISTVAYFLWGIPPRYLDEPQRSGILRKLRNTP